MKERRTRPVIDEGAPPVRILFTMAPICLLVIANQVALCEVRCLHDWLPVVLIERTCVPPTASAWPQSIGHHFHTGVNVPPPDALNRLCTYQSECGAVLQCPSFAQSEWKESRGVAAIGRNQYNNTVNCGMCCTGLHLAVWSEYVDAV